MKHQTFREMLGCRRLGILLRQVTSRQALTGGNSKSVARRLVVEPIAFLVATFEGITYPSKGAFTIFLPGCNYTVML